MEALSAPRGLIVELVTPFNREGGIDGGGLKRLLARTSSFANGVFLASPRAGEGTALSPGLRAQLLEQAIMAMDRNPIPIFIWVTQESEDKTRETIRALGQVVAQHPFGTHLFYVDAPLFYHSNRGLPTLYKELCPMAGAPFILHNDPGLIKGLGSPFKRNNIRTAILKELAGFHEISGIIFTGSLDRAHHYERACRRRPDFRIYDGDESQFLDHPSRSGVVSIGANLAPAAWERITRSSLQLSMSEEEYPDSLQQIWETGDYLRRMHELYAKDPVTIVKDLMARMGTIEFIGRTEPIEEMESPGHRLRELMSRFGDYPAIEEA